MSPAEVIRDDQDRAPARPRRRRLPHRHEVGVHARRRRRPSVRALQRRRGRAGHVQGPRHPHRAARPAVRGHDHRRLRDRRRARASSTCAASTRTCARYLEHVLDAAARRRACSGENICGKAGLRLRHPHPDGRRRLRLRRGDGADQLLRGRCAATRKTRPPFPAQKGYLGWPTVGQQRRDALLRGAHPRDGRRLVRRDRARRAARAPSCSASPATASGPGVYEVPFGITLREVLELCGARGRRSPSRSAAPRARWSGPADFDRTICFDDLATGGSVMVFGPGRDVARDRRASSWSSSSRRAAATARPAGSATCCCKERLERILDGRGEACGPRLPARSWRETVKTTSRCGLGQTSPNPVLSTLAELPRRLRGRA